LPDPKYYKGRAKRDLGVLDADYTKFTPEDRHNLVQAVEESCLAKGGKKVISVTASEYDSYDEILLMTSNGFEGNMESTFYQAGASMTSRRKEDQD